MRFHDGAPFTADDVVFSIGRAQTETSDFQYRVDGIASVQAIDDHTVRITTTAPDPSLWLKLAEVAIMSKAWAQAHGVTEPADFVGGQGDLCLTPRQRHRPIHAPILRAARRLGHGAQS